MSYAVIACTNAYCEVFPKLNIIDALNTLSVNGKHVTC